MLIEPQTYQERVLAEKYELDVRIVRLWNFFDTNVFKTSLSMEEQDVLARQCDAMIAYAKILAERINGFTRPVAA